MNASKARLTVDGSEHLLVPVIAAADEHDRALLVEATEQVHGAAGRDVERAIVQQRCAGETATAAAAAHGVTLAVVGPTEAKQGFLLLPFRWLTGVEWPEAPVPTPRGRGSRLALTPNRVPPCRPWDDHTLALPRPAGSK